MLNMELFTNIHRAEKKSIVSIIIGRVLYLQKLIANDLKI